MKPSVCRIGKTASAKAKAFAGTPVTWPEVLRALQTDRARSTALTRFREAGFSADDFGHVRKAREALAEALTRTEDMHAGPSSRPERVAIRDVRRRLEVELWP